MSSKAETILNNGQYKIESVLGRGEYGITYSAVDVRRQQIVVLKTVNPNLRHHSEFAQFHHHFKAVARRLSQCQHPNLVKVIEVFEDRGLPFMVMNSIGGQTLINSFPSGSQLPVTQAVQFVHQIASALTEIHQQGLIHCNLTPEVILRHPQTSEVILTDFGIATRFTDTMSDGPYLGSRNLSGGYAALEQYLPHEHLTTATDIYGLAAIFYYLLTGQPPLEAPLCLSQVTETLLSQSKPNLRQLRPDLSPTLERVILWGLELEQQHRPQSLEQWLAFLPQLEDYTRVESNQDDQLTQQQRSSENEMDDQTLEQSSGNHAFPRQTEHELLTQTLRFSSGSQFLPLLFGITAILSGYVGFYLTRVYARVSPQITVVKSEKSFEQQFPNYDPSKPMFQHPSVRSQGMMESMSSKDKWGLNNLEGDELKGYESQQQMVSERAWEEDYAREWQPEPDDYEIVESQPDYGGESYYSGYQRNRDDFYSSESYGSVDEVYSSEYPRSSGYSSSEYLQNPYSSPVQSSRDYPSPARLDPPSDRTESRGYAPSSREWSESDSPSYLNSSEMDHSVESEFDLIPEEEFPRNSAPTGWESESVPSSFDRDPHSKTFEYDLPSSSISLPKFEIIPPIPRSEAETEYNSAS